ncbi:MAG: DUF4097 family beta strand repeat-containing protein [Bryobacteraceae bacterium]|nr:DUF4097 family beta strand repeat-containing protein [Bryobacteraceae bacterium]
MKRTSVVAPLILILLGALFLIRNLNPDLPLLSYLARYWPFLLIGWGVLRLVEILTWSTQGKPLPERGISGGEWTLVVFLTIIGSGLFFFREGDGSVWGRNVRARIGGIEILGETFEYPIAGQAKAGKTPRLVIESFRGNARIIGADTEEIKVTGRKTIRSLQQSDAEKADRDTPLEVVAQGDQVIIRSNQERASDNLRLEADMEITVPRGASVEARGRYGDFEINDISGNVEVVSDNAGVRLQKIGGEVKIDLRRSDIVRAIDIKGPLELKGRGDDVTIENVENAVTVNGDYSGTLEFRKLAKGLKFESSQTELSFERVPGLVQMSRGELTASEFVGPARISSRTKDVRLSAFTNSLELSVDRGDIEIRPPAALAKMDIRTRAGDVDIDFPRNAKFEIRAKVDRGDINNDYGSPLRVESEGPRGQRLEGSTGGGPSVVIEAGRGTITVRKDGSGDRVTQSAFPDFPDTPQPKAPKAPAPPGRIDQ